MDAPMNMNTLPNPKEDIMVRSKDHYEKLGGYPPPSSNSAKSKKATKARNEVTISCSSRPGSRRNPIYYEDHQSEENHRPSHTLTKYEEIDSDDDEPDYVDGDPTGRVNYPVWFTRHSKYKKAFQKFQLNPTLPAAIARNEKTIPYASDKRGFGAKTGRDSLKVNQYEFSYPEGQKWTVMWDVEIGLVRITPFFKSLKYAKTQPRKAIAKNAGLEDICYSITGGALAAQGYWVPYEAAMHLAATFCWKIRFALFPLFGEDFLKLCLHPKDPAYESFTIPQEIVQQCVEETKRWSLEAKQQSSSAEPPYPPSRLLSSSSRELKVPASSKKQGRAKTSGKKDSEDDEVSVDAELSDYFEDFTLEETPSPQLGFTPINRQLAPRTPARRSTRASSDGLSFPPAYLFRSESPTPSSSFSHMSVEESEGKTQARYESDDNDVPMKFSRTRKKFTPQDTPSKQRAVDMQSSNRRSDRVSKPRQQRTPRKYHADEYNVAQALLFMASGGHEVDAKSNIVQKQREKGAVRGLEDDQQSVSSIEERGPKRGRGLKHVNCKKKTKLF